MVRVAINGFGRIGRLVFRAGYKDIDFVAINNPSDIKLIAHLLRHDSVHGRFPGRIEIDGSNLVVDGKAIPVYGENDPEELPWKDVDVVVESTGIFRDREGAGKHLKAGAKKVLVSAPGKDLDLTLVMGVNDEVYDKEKHHLISNASCTTNCLAPMVKVLHDSFRIVHGFMTTVHAVTNDQVVLDALHKDWRRARSCLISTIPTTTGAAKAVGEVLPELKGRLDGLALRVPVVDGSITDFVCEIEKQASADEINKAFKNAADGKMREIIEYSEEPLVSADIIGNPHSCIFDSELTKSYGRFVKIVGWYDNEWGYSCRMVDVLKMM